MARKSDPEEKIINAAMKLAAAQGWRALTLHDIARAAKLKLSEMPPRFTSKTAILVAYGRRVDAKVLDAASAEEMDGESLRDRIEKRLCPEDRMLLDIRPLDVRKVTQIDDPESHLDETGRLDAVAATPDLPDRQKRTKAKRAADEAPRGHDGSDDEREG